MIFSFLQHDSIGIQVYCLSILMKKEIVCLLFLEGENPDPLFIGRGNIELIYLDIAYVMNSSFDLLIFNTSH